MKRRLNQLTIVSVGLFLLTALTIKAASVAPGSTFTAAVTCGNIEGNVRAITSNASLISSDNWCDRGRTVTAKAKAGSAGTATITFVTVDAVDVSDPNNLKEANGVTLGGTSVSIVTNNGGGSGGNNGSSGGNSSNNIGNSGNSGGNTYDPGNETVDPKSSDNSLSSLTVSRGTLDPVFDSAVTEYKLVLSADTTSLTIEATAKDEKAKISGTGEKSVKPGDNDLTILVTAEDGSEKTYTIHAYVDENPTVFMKVNGKDYGVIVNVDSVSSPHGFEKTTLDYSGQEIPAWKNNVSNITLVYLIDEKSEKNFYIYEGDRVVSVYKPIALLGNNLAIIDIPEDMQIRKGMIFGEVEIDGQILPGWIFEDAAFSDYSLVYLMNEKGEKVFYQYEKQSNTLQPYSGAAAVTQEKYEELQSQNLYWMIGTGVSGGAAVLFLILWLRSRRHGKYDKNMVKKEMPKKDKPQVKKKEPVSASAFQEKEERPLYHRQRTTASGQEHPKTTGSMDNSMTQPFRFHDDYDD